MANIESNTLLEKLELINHYVCELRQTLINIGGKDLVSDSTSIKDMSNIINELFSSVNTVNALLYIIVNGPDTSDISTKAEDYSQSLPYIESIAESKAHLVTNLETLGIQASIDEPLEDLVQKILLRDS